TTPAAVRQRIRAGTSVSRVLAVHLFSLRRPHQLSARKSDAASCTTKAVRGPTGKKHSMAGIGRHDYAPPGTCEAVQQSWDGSAPIATCRTWYGGPPGGAERHPIGHQLALDGWIPPAASRCWRASRSACRGELLQRTRGPQQMCSREQAGYFLWSVEVRFGANHRG